MRKTSIILSFLIGIAATTVSAQVSVRGHYRSDGTYVQPHVRTAPNSSPYDNWSSIPNVNPYTGREGTVDPNSLPRVPTYRPPAPPAASANRGQSNPYKLRCYYNCR
jgi:hypothetical protein